MNNRLASIFALFLALFFVSCSSSVPPMQKDYADAVTNINQVDPYYRPYFRAQNAANYTLADQRRAYVAAIQTARTPVRASDYKPRAARTRLASRGKGKSYGKRRTVASSKSARGGKKISSSRRAVARGGTKARRGKATASRQGTARRNTSRRRRG